MKKPAFFLCLFFSLIFNLQAADLYSISNGSWTTVGAWSYTNNGPSCNCTPGNLDNVTIRHNILMTLHLTNVGSTQNGITKTLTIESGGRLDGGNTYNIDIRSTGVLSLCGVLVARDVIFSNGSIINICPTGNLTVKGNFDNKNNSNTVTMNGSMTVEGAFSNGNGGIISGNGVMNITNGPVTNLGVVLGCNTINPCASYPCSFSNPCQTPLPIELIYFGAVHTGSNVLVRWETTVEVNNNFFSVERSPEGKSFKNIAVVPGSGSSTQHQNYEWTDIKPLPGTSYYRLRQTDFDGSSKITHPVAVKSKKLSVLELFPNPVWGNSLNIILNEAIISDVHISMNEVSGRTIQKWVYPLESHGNFIFHMELSDQIANGIYFVKILLGSETVHRKLIIAR